MEKISLYKEHSYAACISEGYKFLAQHLRMIAIIFLPYFIALSLCCLLLYIFSIKMILSTQGSNQFLFYNSGAILLITIANYVIYLLATGRCFLMFRRVSGIEPSDANDANGKKTAAWKKTIKRTFQLSVRTLPYTLLLPIALFILYFIFIYLAIRFNPYLGNSVIVMSLMILTLLAASLFINISFIYPFYCHMMKPCEQNMEEINIDIKEFSFKNAYKKGMKHFGKITGVYLLSLFICIITSLILVLPSYIINQAYTNSIISSYKFDDNAIIQDSTLYLVTLFGSISQGFALLLSIAPASSLLYLHGDIITKEK